MKLPLLAALALVMAAAAARAEYPERPVTIVVPFPAGGPTDRVAHDVAAALRQPLGGATLVVENVGGAGGTLGATKVAKAAADGYTLLLFHIGMATAPSLYRKLGYDPLTDFEYLGLINEVPMTLVARATLAPRSFAELERWLRDNGTKAHLAHAGLGSASHLCGLMLQSRLGLELTTIPYKGTAPAMSDLLGGQVDILCDQTTNTAGPIEAGRVRAYAVTSARRLAMPALVGLPTLDEAGLGGFRVGIWHGLYAPRGTPRAIVDRLSAALQAVLRDPQFRQRQEALGALVVTDARARPAGHKAFVTAEIAKWAAVIKAAGQYAD